MADKKSEPQEKDVYVRLNAFRPIDNKKKKHPCKDCFNCLFCSDARCSVCLACHHKKETEEQKD